MKILIYTVLLCTFEFDLHVSGKNILTVENSNKDLHFEFGHANADHSIKINNYSAENQCKEKCGDSNGVQCNGDPCGLHKVTCSCSDENYMFVSKEEGCRVNKCKVKCGNSTGVRCGRDFLDEEEVVCSCSDHGYTFVSKEKGCRANKCKETCGDFHGVVCEGDPYGDEKVNCSCFHEDYRFMSKNRGCVANKCKDYCGGSVGVVCKGDPYGEYYVTCSYAKEDEIFVSKEEGCKACKCINGDCVENNGKYDCICKPGYGIFNNGECLACDCGEGINCSLEGTFFVTKKKCFCPEGQKQVNGKCIANKCKEKCGDSNGVVCEGDPYGEEHVTCTCSDENYMFVSKKEGCKVNKCKVKCGNSIGVLCGRDFLDEEEVVCSCSDHGYTFVSKEKGCRVNKCKETCGDFLGVMCEGDPYGDEEVNCSCFHEGSRFMSKNRGCIANKCEDDCGNAPGVICRGDPYGEYYVSCVCANQNYVFVSKEEGCKACKCESGDCIEHNGKYECICKPEYGMYENGVCHECNCGKGINCTFRGNYVKTKKCLCPKGYEEVDGKCENLCIGIPCKNGGICQIEDNKQICYCKSPYTGEFCEKEVPSCTETDGSL